MFVVVASSRHEQHARFSHETLAQPGAERLAPPSHAHSEMLGNSAHRRGVTDNSWVTNRVSLNVHSNDDFDPSTGGRQCPITGGCSLVNNHNDVWTRLSNQIATQTPTSPTTFLCYSDMVDEDNASCWFSATSLLRGAPWQTKTGNLWQSQFVQVTYVHNRHVNFHGAHGTYIYELRIITIQVIGLHIAYLRHIFEYIYQLGHISNGRFSGSEYIHVLGGTLHGDCIYTRSHS